MLQFCDVLRTHLEPELAKHSLFEFGRTEEVLWTFLVDDHIHDCK